MWCALVGHRLDGARRFTDCTTGRPNGCVDLGRCWPIEDPILVCKLLGGHVCLGAFFKQNAGRVPCVAPMHKSDTFQAIQACCLGCILASIKLVLCIISSANCALG